MNFEKTYKDAKVNPDFDKSMINLIKMFEECLEYVKESNYELYCEMKNAMYITFNGHHFNEHMLKETLAHMINDDGSYAPKWTLEETNQVAKNSGISFTKFNEYDWNYVMNMMYSDYCEVLGENVVSYVKMANKFLNDKDAPDGKALRYAMCMKKDYH